MSNLDRVHYEWGTARAWNEGGLAVLFAGAAGHRQDDGGRGARRTSCGCRCTASISRRSSTSTSARPRRTCAASSTPPRRADAILFFDEADALFGKRTEVKDAHDRYANLEISYLLERMERFKGLAILATNRRKDLDEAFLRRLRFVVEFPLPGAAERAAHLAQRDSPTASTPARSTSTSSRERFPLAGGHIRSIVVPRLPAERGRGRARRALDDGRRADRAVQRELRQARPRGQPRPVRPLRAAGGGGADDAMNRRIRIDRLDARPARHRRRPPAEAAGARARCGATPRRGVAGTPARRRARPPRPARIDAGRHRARRPPALARALAAGLAAARSRDARRGELTMPLLRGALIEYGSEFRSGRSRTS